MTAQAFAAVLLAAAILIGPGRAVVRTRLVALTTPTGTTPSLTIGARLGDSARPLLVALPIGLVPLVTEGGPTGVVFGLALGTAAFLISRRFLRRGTQRDTADPLALASSWDLLAACLRGGLPVPNAVSAIAEEIPGGAGPVLRRTASLLALGADPYDAWVPALDHPATVQLARAARRTARSGAALAGLAEALATEVRTAADDLAEARAQRAAVAVTGPLGLCFLPAFICLGVVPVVIGLATRLMATI